jgi:glycosyltransferase involved in cell wall biosynthesis
MQQPLFSIITANLNSGRKLERTVASIIGQPVDYEHLIFDGASSDGSRELGERLAAASDRIRFSSEPDHGVYAAMNKGIAGAAGRYLYFIGAGDTLKPGSLAAIAPHLPEDQCALVYGNVTAFGRTYDGEFTARKLTAANICHQSAFYGRRVFEICGDFNETYRVFADWEFNMRCFGAEKIRKIHVPVLVADFEPGGISCGRDPEFERDRLRLIRGHLGLGRCAYAVARVWKLRAEARARIARLSAARGLLP